MSADIDHSDTVPLLTGPSFRPFRVAFTRNQSRVALVVMDSIPAGESPDDIDEWLSLSSPIVHSWALTDAEKDLANVRAWARSLLIGHDQECVAEAVLVLDSVVTGAFSAERGPHEIRLTILGASSQLLIEVDAHYAPVTDGNGPTTGEFAGLLLEHLTADWGLRCQERSQTIWAAIDLTAWTGACANARARLGRALGLAARRH